mmetsp:Transcript_48042/g.128561  ORF Transcript_48042/g.128561 Transcript_48042/m.128561 type:complete len:239 (-) Transcript_48042:1120-1836(-)
MPLALSTLAMVSAPWKSLRRRASAQRSSCLSTSRWRPGLRFSAASEPHCVGVTTGATGSGCRRAPFSRRSLSDGLTLSGSMPLERSSARMESAAAKSFSRFAATHRSSADSVSVSKTFVATLLIKEEDAWSCGCATCPKSASVSTAAACPSNAAWSKCTPRSAAWSSVALSNAAGGCPTKASAAWLWASSAPAPRKPPQPCASSADRSGERPGMPRAPTAAGSPKTDSAGQPPACRAA